jgi:hypothetical protein
VPRFSGRGVKEKNLNASTGNRAVIIQAVNSHNFPISVLLNTKLGEICSEFLTYYKINIIRIGCETKISSRQFGVTVLSPVSGGTRLQSWLSLRSLSSFEGIDMSNGFKYVTTSSFHILTYPPFIILSYDSAIWNL